MSASMQIDAPSQAKTNTRMGLSIMAPQVGRLPNASPTFGPNIDPHLLSPDSKRQHTRFVSGSSPTIFALPPLSRQSSSFDHHNRSSPTESPRPSLIRQCSILLPDGTEQTFSNDPSVNGYTPRSSTPVATTDNYHCEAIAIVQTLQLCVKRGIITQDQAAIIVQIHNCR